MKRHQNSIAFRTRPKSDVELAVLPGLSKAQMQDILNVEEAFGDLEDPRSRTPAHDLTEMLVVALCAILCGADNWFAISV